MFIVNDTILSNKYDGDITVTGSLSLSGIVTGNIKLNSGGKCYITGILNGSLYLVDDTLAEVHGIINGKVYNNGGIVDIFGIVGAISTTSGKTTLHDNAIVKNSL